MPTITPNEEDIVIFNEAGPHSIQAKPTEGHEHPQGIPTVPKPIVTFYKGQPEALGATQVFIGVWSLAFAIVLLCICDYACYYPTRYLNYTGVMIWTGIGSVVSGALSLAASVKPTLGKVRSSLVLNIISSVMGGLAIIVFSIYFTSNSSFTLSFCALYEGKSKCEGSFDIQTFLGALLIQQFLMSLLMFSIAISTSVFTCRTVCRTSYQDVTVVIYQTATTTEPKAFSSIPGPSNGM